MGVQQTNGNGKNHPLLSGGPPRAEREGVRASQTQTTAGKSKPAQIVFTPVVRIPQGDGAVLLKPGTPVIVDTDLIGAAEAARLLGMSRRWVLWRCQEGFFKTAYQPGRDWRIARAEVLALRGIK